MSPVAHIALSLMLLAPADAATTSATCEEALVAQDEVIVLLEQKVAALELALAERKSEVVALRHHADALTEEGAAYRRLWLAEAEAGAADRKRAWWAEKFTAVKWAVAGAAGGVLLERFAE